MVSEEAAASTAARRTRCVCWGFMGPFPAATTGAGTALPTRPAAFLDSDGDQDASRWVFRLARDGSRAHGCGSAPVSDRLSPARAHMVPTRTGAACAAYRSTVP